MRDIRVVQAKASLKVTSVAPIRGFVPPAVLVLGEQFNKAETVLYNGVEAPEFFIASPTRLVVKIPDAQVGQPLISLSVLSPSAVINIDALVTLGIPRLSRAVTGIDKLVQDWLLVFMTTPSSDIFDPSIGGGAQAIIGKPVSNGGQSAMAELSQAVDRSRQQLIRLQAKYPRIPPSEKLLSASLSDVRFNTDTTTLSAVVDLRNMAGATASVTIR